MVRGLAPVSSPCDSACKPHLRVKRDSRAEHPTSLMVGALMGTRQRRGHLPALSPPHEQTPLLCWRGEAIPLVSSPPQTNCIFSKK